MKIHQTTYTVEDLLPYIDWSYFFHAWGITHKNTATDAAIQLKAEAIETLKKSGNEYKINTLFGLFDTHVSDDDIIINNIRLPLLRQQHTRSDKPNICLSDFINPQGDKIGLFATAIEETSKRETNKKDPYHALLIKTLSDRLAEAAATLLHLKVRTQSELWGYAPEEHLSIEELHREAYQGIRPAVGYPSLPDQSIIFIIDKLLGLKQIGITLTSTGAMYPHAAVCGLMLSHPAAHYFQIGKISDEQIESYSRRRGIPKEEIRKFLIKNI